MTAIVAALAAILVAVVVVSDELQRRRSQRWARWQADTRIAMGWTMLRGHQLPQQMACKWWFDHSVDEP